MAKTGVSQKAASEFTQETSEQLAKHGDDLARELDSAEAGERLAQEAEDYLKTHDMAVRENLSIRPELEEAFARQAENSANLERELVGAGARASAESGQAFAQHGDDVARGLAKTGKGKKAKEELLDGEGVFKNAELEERYQEYVVRNTNRGRRISDRLTWKQDSDFFTQNSPIARGNRFNETVQERKTYPHHEVNLENGKRLDSYDPTAGEIISRKATDLDRIQEETFRGYLQELQDKYSVGETIRSNKYPEIDGLKLDGKHILEIPDSNKHLPDIEKFKEIAKEYGVELRFTKE